MNKTYGKQMILMLEYFNTTNHDSVVTAKT